MAASSHEEEQSIRNGLLSSDACVHSALAPFLEQPTSYDVASFGREVTLLLSPFPNRRAVLLVSPVDSLFDDTSRRASPPAASDSSEAVGPASEIDPPRRYVVPAPLPCCPKRASELTSTLESSSTTVSCTRSMIASKGFYRMKQVTLTDPSESTGELHSTKKNSKGPYEELQYIRDDKSVPFTALVSTLAMSAQMKNMDSRRARIDSNWSLQWVKKPLPSDWTRVRATSFQKFNHFPQSALLTSKGSLHQLLTAAAEYEKRNELSSSTAPSSFARFDPLSQGFPDGYLLPQDRAKLESFIRSPSTRGKWYIAKPTSSACGRGIHVLEGGSPSIVLPTTADAEAALMRKEKPSRLAVSSETHSPAAPSSSKSHGKEGVIEWTNETFQSSCHGGKDAKSGSKTEKASWIVQRYIDRPFLVHGYKFDLRLYVVVTSYVPLRVYLYHEGLVRFATSPYYLDASSEKSEDLCNTKVAPPSRIAAHLTNFTINKKSEDFVVPQYSADSSAPDSSTVSKWSLAALRAYVEQQEYSWEETWKSIRILLSKVFLAARPHVKKGLKEEEEKKEMRKKAGGASRLSSSISSDSPDAIPPFTSHGISPFFEFYGVDVLLTAPEEKGMVGLHPQLLEVNIMPSLSTHYSPLDQCIKGNFIADALTLVGLASPLFKPPGPTAFPFQIPADAFPASPRTSCLYSFLENIKCVTELEAVLVAEEESQRSPHFDRVFPPEPKDIAGALSSAEGREAEMATLIQSALSAPFSPFKLLNMQLEEDKDHCSSKLDKLESVIFSWSMWKFACDIQFKS